MAKLVPALDVLPDPLCVLKQVCSLSEKGECMLLKMISKWLLLRS